MGGEVCGGSADITHGVVRGSGGETVACVRRCGDRSRTKTKKIS